MAEQNKTIQIIGNESNNTFEVEGGNNAPAATPNTNAQKVKDAEQLDASFASHPAERHNDEIATNDGSVIETLDTDFHGKPGVSEGENLSGSDRADYYEARSQGKTDSEEELDTLNDQP
jgi:hypothetical protein